MSTGARARSRWPGRGVLIASVPFAAFFLSGASSLIFQNLWARMLQHVFGATSVAVSTVVTVFMAGLGLGAWVAGRYADRLRRPLLAYAAAEAMAGLWGLLVPLLVDPEGWLASVNHWLRASLGAGTPGFMLARFLCVVPVLLVPTTLMGASLPLLARHFTSTEDGRPGAVGTRVGALYAVNTFGAVAGVLGAGFLLMPWIGVAATNAVAVGLDLFVAAAMVAVHRWYPGEAVRPGSRAPVEFESEAAPAGAERKPPSERPPWVRRAVLVAFGVSGAAALAYEVAWTRALAMTIGASIYSFALILGTFLVGIAGGSAVASAVLAGRDRPLSAVALGAVALTPLATLTSGIRGGALLWCLVTALLVAAIVGVRRIARVRRRAVQLPGARPGVRGPMLLMLAIPCAAAALPGLLLGDTISRIVLAVTVTVAVLFAVLALARRAPLLQLALVQLFVAGATFVSYLLMDHVPCAFVQMVKSLPSASDHIGAVQFFMFLTAGLCTLPSTLGMGAMFPLTLHLWSGGARRVGRDVGVVYASNTVGSIVGAWLPGFVLMPLVGLERTLHAGIWTNLTLGLLLALASQSGRRSGWPSRAVNAIAVLVPIAAAVLYLGTARPDSPLRWDLGRMTLGVFRLSSGLDACTDESFGGPDIVYYHDGLATTVSVERWGRHLALKNDGKVDASNGDDMPTQIMVSAYPLLMHEGGPEGLSVAMVGFGSGVSVGAALQFPIASLDVVELERSVVDASRWFSGVNHLHYDTQRFPYVRAPRLRVHNDDGRNFLASTDRRFDVIISEPSNPWITGVSDLFTTDHFRVSRRRLAPGGVYCQWVQMYEMSPTNIQTIMRTFATEFPHVKVFFADDFSSDAILVGSDEPLTLDVERVRQAMAHPHVREELARADVHTPFDAFARLMLGSRGEVMRYTHGAPLNTDDNARIELAAPKNLIGYAKYEHYLATVYSPSWPYGRVAGRLRSLPDDASGQAEAWARMAEALAAVGKNREAWGAVKRARRLADGPDIERTARVLGLLYEASREPEPTFEPPLPGPQLERHQARQLMATYALLRKAIARRAYGPALEALEAVPPPLRVHSGPSLRFMHAYLLYEVGPDDEDTNRYLHAAEELEDLVQTDERWVARHPEVFYYLARAQYADLQYDRGLANMRQYVRLADRAARAARAATDAPEGSP